MGYRSDEEALRARVQNLEEQLDDRAEHANETERLLRGRIAEFERAGAKSSPTNADEPAAASESRAKAVLLRAGDLERDGLVEEAASLLLEYATSGWPKSRAELELGREAFVADPCPKAGRLFEEQRATIYERARRRDVRLSVTFFGIYGTLTLACVALGIASSFYWFIGALLAGFAATPFLLRLNDAIRGRERWRTPVWGTVLQADRSHESGVRSDAIVRLDDAPEKNVAVAISEDDTVEPGMRALLVRTWEGARWLP